MAKHNNIVPKKRGRPFGSKNKPKPPAINKRLAMDHNKTTTITASSRLEIDAVRLDLEQRTGMRVPLRQVITYLCDSYMAGEFK